MTIKVGGLEVADVRVGGVPATAVRVGATLVWPPDTPGVSVWWFTGVANTNWGATTAPGQFNARVGRPIFYPPDMEAEPIPWQVGDVFTVFDESAGGAVWWGPRTLATLEWSPNPTPPRVSHQFDLTDCPRPTDGHVYRWERQ